MGHTGSQEQCPIGDTGGLKGFQQFKMSLCAGTFFQGLLKGLGHAILGNFV